MRWGFNAYILPPVCAEAFNPDEDDEDSEPRIVHPKTDEQRCRLQEACKDILLFKALDQVDVHTNVSLIYTLYCQTHISVSWCLLPQTLKHAIV